MTPKTFFFRASSRVARKLGFWPLLRKLYLSLFHERMTLESMAEMKASLAQFTPPMSRSYGSSLCHNTIAAEYDLQIIVPAYKVEKYIDACMESVLSQDTRYNILLTVVNDGSPDGTRDLLRKYENLPQVEIIDQENRGFSGARNAGLRVIKGRYVTFLDSDDMLAPHSIDALMDKAVATGADIVEGSHTTFRGNGFDYHTDRHTETMGEKWLGVLFGFPWGKVYRAQLFEHLCFPEGYWFEDTLCSFLIHPMAKKICTIPDVVYRYRSNPQGITSTSRGNPKVIDTLLITMQLLEEAREMGLLADAQLYDMFLVQVRNNAGRISTLSNAKLDKLVFRISCNLRKEYFPNSHTQRDDLRLVEQSLDSTDFMHYQIALA